MVFKKIKKKLVLHEITIEHKHLFESKIKTHKKIKHKVHVRLKST